MIITNKFWILNNKGQASVLHSSSAIIKGLK